MHFNFLYDCLGFPTYKIGIELFNDDLSSAYALPFQKFESLSNQVLKNMMDKEMQSSRLQMTITDIVSDAHVA